VEEEAAAERDEETPAGEEETPAEEETPTDETASGCGDENGDCTQVVSEEPNLLGTLDCTLTENIRAVDCGGTDPTICPFGSYFDAIK